MAFHFHENIKLYYEIQRQNAQNSILPYTQNFFPKNFQGRVLEVGCNMGGNLRPFIEQGWQGVGVDINGAYIENAFALAKENELSDNVSFLEKNIFDISAKEDDFYFDLIILKDVIEHVEDHQDFLRHLATFLKPTGKLFVAFPPWYMPFGGHQQGSKNWFVARSAFLHFLPMPLYLSLFQFVGDEPEFVTYMKETKERGILIEKFQQILKTNNLEIIQEDFFFIAPIYEVKFGLKPKALWKPLTKLKWLRNFYTTSVYYMLQNQSPNEI